MSRRISWRFFSVVALGVLTLGGCSEPANVGSAGPATPGWTGRTVVVGNNSTVAGDAEATYLAQKWPYGGRH